MCDHDCEMDKMNDVPDYKKGPMSPSIAVLYELISDCLYPEYGPLETKRRLECIGVPVEMIYEAMFHVLCRQYGTMMMAKADDKETKDKPAVKDKDKDNKPEAETKKGDDKRQTRSQKKINRLCAMVYEHLKAHPDEEFIQKELCIALNISGPVFSEFVSKHITKLYDNVSQVKCKRNNRAVTVYKYLEGNKMQVLDKKIKMKSDYPPVSDIEMVAATTSDMSVMAGEEGESKLNPDWRVMSFADSNDIGRDYIVCNYIRSVAEPGKLCTENGHVIRKGSLQDVMLHILPEEDCKSLPIRTMVCEVLRRNSCVLPNGSINRLTKKVINGTEYFISNL